MGEPSSVPDLDAVVGRVAAELLAGSHLLPPGEVALALTAAGGPLGISAVRIYLADLQQRHLRLLPGSIGPSPEELPIDATIAGSAYRLVSIRHAPADDRSRHYVWLPLMDGTERLGVLELEVRDASDAMLSSYRTVAALAGLMIAGKSSYIDIYARTPRSREMALQAEMVWAFMVPRTFATERVLVAAALEPAYEVGGDAFDYSLTGDRLHVSIFDATGHDLEAGLAASVALASCRKSRRSGGTLRDVATRADEAIEGRFGNRFVTALLCDLNITTGQFTWIPCGHPPPLLIRGHQVIRELARTPRLPLGLADIGAVARHGLPGVSKTAPVYSEVLEPRDRLLLYTDGVTEGRGGDGTPFGLRRLSDFIIRHSDAGTPAPETLRRLNLAITEYQHGQLSDDATIVLLEWMPAHPQLSLAP